MSIKKNEATRQRPAGDRFLDSPALVVNLPSWLDQLMREESWKDSDRNAVTVAKSDRITVTLIALHEGAMMGNKELERFFMAEVLAGNVQLELQGGEVRLEKGDLIVLHPEVRRNLFLILKESLHNAIKYSGTDKIDIDFSNENESFNLNIRDYGKGMDGKTKDDFSNGLRNMKMRAEQIQSLFKLITAPGKGVQIAIEGKLY